MTTGIERAREELFAAHLLTSTNFSAQAVALAHRAGLAAAQAALVALDRVPPADPGMLVALFLRHVVRERGLDGDAGRLLRAVHNRAVLADDGIAVPPEEARRTIADATMVVDVVDTWLTSSEFVGIVRSVMAPARPGPPPSRRRRRR